MYIMHSKQSFLSEEPTIITYLLNTIGSFLLCSFKHVNYQDPNLNIAYPLFSVHGNHDDPTGVSHKNHTLQCGKRTQKIFFLSSGCTTSLDDKKQIFNTLQPMFSFSLFSFEERRNC